jgi:hypothetical protein
LVTTGSTPEETVLETGGFAVPLGGAVLVEMGELGKIESDVGMSTTLEVGVIIVLAVVIIVDKLPVVVGQGHVVKLT